VDNPGGPRSSLLHHHPSLPLPIPLPYLLFLTLLAAKRKKISERWYSMET